MKTITIKLNEIQYAQIKAMKDTGYTPHQLLINGLENTQNGIDIHNEFETFDYQKYNEVFVSELRKCGMVLKPEAERKYLYKKQS